MTGDSIKRYKPHPLPYLTAAKKLLVNSSECLVVENAPFGIESAKRAKMYCVAMCSTLEKKYLKKVNETVNNITEIRELL